MERALIAMTFGAAVAACGPSDLKWAGHKAVTFSRQGSDPAALGTITLRTSICDALAGQELVATLGGRPLQLVALGGPELDSDGNCPPTIWKETAPTPAGEALTQLIIQDDTERLYVNFSALSQAPAVTLNPSGKVKPGSAVPVALELLHTSDVITGAHFTDDESGGTKDWTLSAGDAPGSYVVSVPGAAKAGSGQLTFDILSTIGETCASDVVCDDSPMNVAHGTVSTVTRVAFVSAPQPLTVHKD